MHDEPIMDVAHLGHIELLTPWGLKTIESFHTHGTPPLPPDEAVTGQDDLAEKGIAS